MTHVTSPPEPLMHHMPADDVSEIPSAAESESSAQPTPEHHSAPTAQQTSTEEQQHTVAEYKVWVHTSACNGAGTEGPVLLELHGQQDSSGLQRLDLQQGHSFAKGQVNTALLNDS